MADPAPIHGSLLASLMLMGLAAGVPAAGGLAAEGPDARGPAGCAALTTAARALETKAILKVISDMQDAWNRGDFRGYMQGFKNPDVVFVSGGRFQQGWQGTLDHYIRDYGASPASRGTLRFHDIQVEMLAADAAQLVSQYELIRPEHPQYGINTRLMRKVDGRWVIALNHVSSREAP